MYGRPPRRHQVKSNFTITFAVTAAVGSEYKRGFCIRLRYVAKLKSRQLPTYKERVSRLPQHIDLGENIARGRRQSGLTQDELGSLLGVSPQAVSKWERNVACPDVMLLPQLARALGITLDALFAPPNNTSNDDENRGA